MTERPRLQMDGIVEQKQDEFITFVVRCSTQHINIPKQVFQELSITNDAILQVALRKITEEECHNLFIGLPPKIKHTKHFTLKPRIICPVCKKPGRIQILTTRKKFNAKVYAYKAVRISHVYSDGFDDGTIHYVGKKKFPEFFEQFISKSKQENQK